MSKYVKETSRIPVKYIDFSNEEEILEVPDRNQLNIGELFSDGIATQLIQAKLKNKKLPKKIWIIASVCLELKD